jgi:hypothetical protein
MCACPVFFILHLVSIFLFFLLLFVSVFLQAKPGARNAQDLGHFNAIKIVGSEGGFWETWNSGLERTVRLEGKKGID